MQLKYIWNAQERSHVPINRQETEYVPLRLVNLLADTVDLSQASAYYQRLPYNGTSAQTPRQRAESPFRDIAEAPPRHC